MTKTVTLQECVVVASSSERPESLASSNAENQSGYTIADGYSVAGNERANSLHNSLVFYLSELIVEGLPCVQEVWYMRNEYEDRPQTVFHIWAVLEDLSPHARKKVYEREQRILDRFEDSEFDFDFYTSTRAQEPRTGFIQAYPRNAHY